MGNAFDLRGKRIAIAGAGGGIGQATARLVAEMGAEVLLSDLEAPAPLADYLAGQGGTATASALDVTDRGAVEDWANSCGAVDALVDCAAICPFDDWGDDGWDQVAARVFNINLQGPINLTRAFMAGMIEREGGQIALVGSIAGRLGGVRAAPHYVMSKGGIHGFVRWAAKKGAPHGVLVNAVAPGPVATPMTQGEPFEPESFPMRRIAQAEEIAGPLAFLVSPAASYVSGAVLDINGAMHFS
ncbi:MAG: SDR family oxidoreductase [Alphaproteobacteria bacterium]|jgi:3-oxoacyl-[acyl-carrier protein] reductase|nr:SDR family oxidoreductase [Alphaproteobacteria bacterium]